jgi:hypothetical protein
MLIALPPLLPVSHLHAAQAPIQDNSFLIEEAYNQDAGVVQHISTFVRSSSGGDWVYSFTQEWPLGGMRHQLSYSIALEHSGAYGGAGLGDAFVNYRYQLVGRDAEATLLVAPRLSLQLPTGNAGLGRGSGSVGVQVNVPLTYVVAPKLATHWNAGFTVLPSAEGSSGVRAATFTPALGVGAVWLVRPLVNPLVELLWVGRDDVTGAGRSERTSELYLNPGLRWAVNQSGARQWTFGVAYTVGLTEASGDGVFLYLSFEHPFRRSSAPTK